MTNSPPDLELAILSTPVSLFFIVTAASEMTAFVGSVTVPRKLPVGVCANAATAIAISKESGKKMLTERFIWFLLDCEEQCWGARSGSGPLNPPLSSSYEVLELSAALDILCNTFSCRLLVHGLFN